MIWLEKDYVYGGWYVWFGKRGPKYLPDGTKWLSRGVPGQSSGYSLNPLPWLGWFQLICYRLLPLLVPVAIFMLGMLVGKHT